MRLVFIINVLLIISFSTYAQVPNKNEAELPSEGVISETSWGNYLLSNNTASRALRIGVSNDGYTRGEIEIDNNNSIGSNIILKTTNVNGGALQRMIIRDNGNVGIGTSNPIHRLEIVGALALKNGNTDLLFYRDTNVGDWSLLRTNTGNGIGLIGQPDDIALSVSRTTSNVGIGTTNPTAKLHIEGNGVRAQRFSVSNINDRIYDSPWYGIGRSSFTDLSNDDLVPSVQLAGYYGILLKTSAGSIGIHQNGNVGIGTTNPAAKLHVEGNGVRAQRFSVSNINDIINNSPWYGIGRSSFTDLSNDDSVPSVQLAGYYGILLKTSAGSIGIHQNGNVGIGTTKPDAKLTVKGKIHAEEVKIDLSVPAPDYVFKKEYDLLTIDEVQQHIQEKGHLPNIPSAKVMETEGVDLGVMNMKLLEKIEELTLYTISQHKELTAQKEEIQILKQAKNRLEILEEKMKFLLKNIQN